MRKFKINKTVISFCWRAFHSVEQGAPLAAGVYVLWMEAGGSVWKNKVMLAE